MVTLSVRHAQYGDAAAIAQVYGPYVEQSTASFEDVAPDAVEVLGRMQAPPRLPWLVADDHDRGVVGFAYEATHRQRAAYRWSVDCSVYIAAEAQRRGTGRLLYGELLSFLSHLGYLRAYTGIVLRNPASVRLHESVGFEPVGVYRQVGYKQGAWHHVGWWELSLRAIDLSAKPPNEPTSWRPSDVSAVLFTALRVSSTFL